MLFTSAQSCPTLCDPMDCSPPGSLEIKPTSLAAHALAGGFFTTESPGKPPLLHFILAKRQRSEKFSKGSIKNYFAGFYRKAFYVASLGTGYVCDSSSKFEHV